MIIMEEKKSNRGRPRKYKSDAERKKAYRERKKALFEEIKERVKILEDKIEMMSEIRSKMTPELSEVQEELKIPWMKLTPEEIAEMETEKLRKYRDIIHRNFGIAGHSFPRSSVMNPFLELVKLSEASIKTASMTSLLIEKFQQIVLLYLIEAELARRKRETNVDRDIEVLIQRVSELEKTLVNLGTEEE